MKSVDSHKWKLLLFSNSSQNETQKFTLQEGLADPEN